MGTGLNDADQVGAMVVDVGGGTTDIAVLCDTGVVVSESLRIGEIPSMNLLSVTSVGRSDLLLDL